eukprot:CAMPEP_0170198838 /NCGR_PEP_ID=MMETSP0040_2-20121228/69005_1 /TAXON_ID=641309 /ORGANISM="Lotharella oceanica, Strain CCMP622" /LENGTH=420 /DNA_ID=CAMNT_0010448895 /DNA_START=56 /DNA_END=1321 /DNA_ORIENTATION=-
MPIAEHLRRWGEMKKGTEFGLKCVLRAKISMTHVNKCMRDPAMYRCKIQTHHKTGDKYKVYPTYDFACPIVDSIEGVTHALRTVEYKDRDQQYNWFIEKLGIRPVHIWSYSRLNMRYTVLSKRKLKAFVEKGTVEGWSDPRFPTVQGVIRRGLRVDALREFILEVGASVNDNMMSWDKVWAINKKKIDPVAHRFLAITENSKVMMTITNFTEPAPVSAAGATAMDVQLHPKDKSIGMKKMAIGDKIWLEAEDASLFTEGEEVTLMRWGNCRITKITKDTAGNVTALEGALNLSGDVKKTKYKVTWLAAAGGGDAKSPESRPVKITCVEFDHLITKPRLEDGDNYNDFVTECSRFETQVLGEAALRKVAVGQLIQLERRGYFRCDVAADQADASAPIVLFNIPTGKKKSMSSVKTKVATKS